MATNRRQHIQLSPDEQAAFFRERKKAALASAPKRVVLRIVPEKVVAWDHRKLGGRY